MNYQTLLYARSFIEDWRWIKTSEYLTEDELNLLKSFWSDYKDNYDQYFQGADISPAYFIRFQKASVVAKCSISKFSDNQTRTIFLLEGVCIPHQYLRQLWFVLPSLLRDESNILCTWSFQDAKAADYINGKKIENLIENRQLNLSEFDQTIDNFIQMGHSYPPQPIPSVIKFDRAGFTVLEKYLSDPHTPLTYFLFGTTPNLDAKRLRSGHIRFDAHSRASSNMLVGDRSKIDKPDVPSELPEMPTTSSIEAKVHHGKSYVSKPHQAGEVTSSSRGDIDEAWRRYNLDNIDDDASNEQRQSSKESSQSNLVQIIKNIFRIK